MRETLRHQEAFDLYYSMGEKRSCGKVGVKLGFSETSVLKWRKAFNWEKRVEQRDIDTAKKMQAKTDKAVLNTKADYRQMIQDNIKMTRALMATMIDPATKKLKAGIAAKSINDYDKLSATLERLVKLDLGLIGERAELDGVEELRITIVSKKTEPEGGEDV